MQFQHLFIVYVTYLCCADIGRGLMALRFFKPGDVIISLPENLLITSGSVLNSSFGHVLCRFVTKCNLE